MVSHIRGMAMICGVEKQVSEEAAAARQSTIEALSPSVHSDFDDAMCWTDGWMGSSSSVIVSVITKHVRHPTSKQPGSHSIYTFIMCCWLEQRRSDMSD